MSKSNPEYSVKTVFPASENDNGNKHTTTKQTDELFKQSASDVLKLYNSYASGGYKVSASYSKPKDDANKTPDDPFKIADNLTKSGIDYKAQLKIKSKGSYKDMKKAYQLVLSEGYDLTATVQLKINDQTSLDMDDPATWTDEDAVLKINPKASSKNAADLKALYDELNNAGYETEIAIKPKMPKGTDMSDPANSFINQLKAYPDGTLVTFRLTESDE